MVTNYLKNNAKAIGTEIRILVFIFVVVGVAALFSDRAGQAAGRLLIGGLAFLSLYQALKGRKLSVFLADLATTTEGRVRLYTAIVIFVLTGLFFILVTYVVWMDPRDIASGNVTRIRMFLIPIGLVFFYLSYRLHRIIRLNAARPPVLDGAPPATE